MRKYFLSMSFDDSNNDNNSSKNTQLNKDDARGLSEILGKITEITSLRRRHGMRLTMSARFTALHRPFSISQICVPKAHASTHIVGGSDSNERKICGWEKSKSAIKEQ